MVHVAPSLIVGRKSAAAETGSWLSHNCPRWMRVHYAFDSSSLVVHVLGVQSKGSLEHRGQRATHCNSASTLL